LRLATAGAEVADRPVFSLWHACQLAGRSVG
jgi:hypothetical protein